MRRLTNRLLVLLALALLALGAAAQFALIHAPVPPLVFVAAAAILGLLLVLRSFRSALAGRSCSWLRWLCWRR